MSLMVVASLWSKSARQQGVVVEGAALQAALIEVKRRLGPAHAACKVTAQAAPMQQAPMGCGQGFGAHAPKMVHAPWHSV